MSRLAIAIAATALLPFAAAAQEKTSHSDYLRTVTVRKPLHAFSQVVGARHFVGFFVVANDGCAVTVVDATVGGDLLAGAPRKQKFVLPAGGRTEIKADHGKALGVGCSADANEITVAVLEPDAAASASN
jgi:hypothetical protein